MYIIEFFNHPAATGETVFAGSKFGAMGFLDKEAETLLTPMMRSRADNLREYIRSIPVPQDDITWDLESEGSSAYYVFSKCAGKHAKQFADN